MARKTPNSELRRLSDEAYKSAEKLPLTIVLDNIRSGLNVGSVFRTSDAFRLEKIILTGICAQPPHRDILKSALGATKTVEWEYVENPLEAVTHLQSQGYLVASLEQAEGSVMLQNWSPQLDQKWALVLGNEVKGVKQDVVDASDVVIEIPQFGTKHSLNISVSMGMAAWHYTLQVKGFDTMVF
ncbi:MAG: RNA methyltransferase [Flavobacteriales bacterium]|nr:RNA methyltransferase [Flavobacteriales bacterium]